MDKKLKCYHSALKNKKSVVLTEDGSVTAAIDEHGILYLTEAEFKAAKDYSMLGGKHRIFKEDEEGFENPPKPSAGDKATAVDKAAYELQISELETKITELEAQTPEDIDNIIQDKEDEIKVLKEDAEKSKELLVKADEDSKAGSVLMLELEKQIQDKDAEIAEFKEKVQELENLLKTASKKGK